MHGLKALSLAHAFVEPHEPAHRERRRVRRASWARRLVAAGQRRVAPAHPVPRVRNPRPTA